MNFYELLLHELQSKDSGFWLFGWTSSEMKNLSLSEHKYNYSKILFIKPGEEKILSYLEQNGYKYYQAMSTAEYLKVLLEINHA